MFAFRPFTGVARALLLASALVPATWAQTVTTGAMPEASDNQAVRTLVEAELARLHARLNLMEDCTRHGKVYNPDARTADKCVDVGGPKIQMGTVITPIMSVHNYTTIDTHVSKRNYVWDVRFEEPFERIPRVILIPTRLNYSGLCRGGAFTFMVDNFGGATLNSNSNTFDINANAMAVVRITDLTRSGFKLHFVNDTTVDCVQMSVGSVHWQAFDADSVSYQRDVIPAPAAPPAAN